MGHAQRAFSRAALSGCNGSVAVSWTRESGLVNARKRVSMHPATVNAGIAITSQTQGLRCQGSCSLAVDCISIILGRAAEAAFLDDDNVAVVKALQVELDYVTAA